MGTEGDQFDFSQGNSYIIERRTKAAVPVMNKHVAAEGNSSVVVNAACSVSNIPHYYGQCRSKPCERTKISKPLKMNNRK